jgi:dTDP-4-dehydrorhamnose 3,5-epimerase-like enzyme
MNDKTSIFNCNIIELEKINDRAGNLTVVEEWQLPFPLKRIYYLYDIPSGADRGGHAHKVMHHFMVAASGAFHVVLDDGNNKKVIELNRPNYGLHIPPGIWVELINFSSGAISLNIVSTNYDESDYMRDYQEFLLSKNRTKKNIK